MKERCVTNLREGGLQHTVLLLFKACEKLEVILERVLLIALLVFGAPDENIRDEVLSLDFCDDPLVEALDAHL